MATALFPRPGAVGPDGPALEAAIAAALGAQLFAVQVRQIDAVFTAVVDKNLVWTPGETAAVQTAVTNAPDSSRALTGQTAVDNIGILEKAVFLTALDQINVLRVNAGLTAITVPQALAAVRAKAGTL